MDELSTSRLWLMRGVFFALALVILFFLLLPLMKRTLTISLDTDWVWRVLLFRTARAAYLAVAAAGVALQARVRAGLEALRSWVEALFGTRLGRAGVFARAWSIGSIALWSVVLLTAYVLVYVL